MEQSSSSASILKSIGSTSSTVEPSVEKEMDLDIQYQQDSLPEVENKKRRKVVSRRKTSIVWDFFEVIKDADSSVQKAKCKFCDNSYFADPSKNGTSSMKAHISKCEKNPCNQSLSTQTQLIFGNNQLLSWKFDQEVVRKAVATMLILDELPFRHVEGEGFKYLMNAACPNFSVPSRKTIRNDCYDLYLEGKEKLKHVLKTSTGRICFTTDTWTSVQRVNYMCLTAHFIDDKWNLHKKVLNLCPITSHRGADIGEALIKCWQDWGITNIFTITVDNASSNDTAIAYLKKKFASWNKCILGGKWSHMRCIAHIMHLIVKDGLDEYKGGIECIRAAIKFVRNSPSRLNIFREVCLVEGIEYKKHLCLDVSTRWNSTYVMLNSAIRYIKVFESLCEDNSQIKEALKKPNGPGIPTSKDWEDARRLSSFLETFYYLTKQISGTKYITANEFLGHIYEVDALLKLWIDSSDSQMSSMATSMKAKFEKYWGDITKMNKLIFIASVLDPKHKMIYVNLLLSKIYGTQQGSILSNETKAAMQEIFEDYNRLYAPSEPALNINVSSSVSQCNNILTELDPRAKIRAQLEEEFDNLEVLSEKEENSELDKYLKEGRESKKSASDVLRWWKDNSARFPILSQMARDVLAVPISTVASESTFSTGGRVLDEFRSSLTPKVVQALICSQDWMRSANELVNVEETWAELVSFEEEITSSGRDNNVIDRL